MNIEKSEKILNISVTCFVITLAGFSLNGLLVVKHLLNKKSLFQKLNNTELLSLGALVVLVIILIVIPISSRMVKNKKRRRMDSGINIIDDMDPIDDFTEK